MMRLLSSFYWFFLKLPQGVTSLSLSLPLSSHALYPSSVSLFPYLVTSSRFPRPLISTSLLMSCLHVQLSHTDPSTLWRGFCIKASSLSMQTVRSDEDWIKELFSVQFTTWWRSSSFRQWRLQFDDLKSCLFGVLKKNHIWVHLIRFPRFNGARRPIKGSVHPNSKNGGGEINTDS